LDDCAARDVRPIGSTSGGRVDVTPVLGWPGSACPDYPDCAESPPEAGRCEPLNVRRTPEPDAGSQRLWPPWRASSATAMLILRRTRESREEASRRLPMWCRARLSLRGFPSFSLPLGGVSGNPLAGGHPFAPFPGENGHVGDGAARLRNHVICQTQVAAARCGHRARGRRVGCAPDADALVVGSARGFEPVSPSWRFSTDGRVRGRHGAAARIGT
jgi:hypothetical protein